VLAASAEARIKACDPEADRAKIWLDKLKPYTARLAQTPELIVEGKLSRMVGLTLEAEGVPGGNRFPLSDRKQKRQDH